MDTQASVRGNAETEKASSFDVIVIGAGVAGLYQLYKLRELGLSVRAPVSATTRARQNIASNGSPV
jgi:succinate dehydrogenase/fumarate reductase flavoprotein subunit